MKRYLRDFRVPLVLLTLTTFAAGSLGAAEPAKRKAAGPKAPAQTPVEPALAPDPQAAKKVTVNFENTPLRTAIDLLFAGSGLQYSLDPNVQNVPVTLKVRDVSIQQALR